MVRIIVNCLAWCVILNPTFVVMIQLTLWPTVQSRVNQLGLAVNYIHTCMDTASDRYHL